MMSSSSDNLSCTSDKWVIPQWLSVIGITRLRFRDESNECLTLIGLMSRVNISTARLISLSTLGLTVILDCTNQSSRSLGYSVARSYCVLIQYPNHQD
jgi:hypothetical protein